MRAALILLLVATATPASAQLGLCGPRAEIVVAITKDHGESLIGLGLSTSGALIELYVSDEGTWIVVANLPGGLSCIVDAGTDWHTAKPKGTDA